MTRQSAADIEREAVDWVVRLDAEGRSTELLAKVAHWEAGDPRRRGALLQAEAALALFDAPDTDASAAHSAFRPTRRGLLTGGLGALAAGFAAFLFIGTGGETYTTRVGEIRRVPLADGSIAAVNSGSSIRVSIGDRHRTVEVDEGEAWFQVAHDTARPFEVVIGTAHVRAVGTAFSVRRRADGIDVLVSEGTVEMWSGGMQVARLRVSAGGRAFVGADGAVAVPTDASGVDRALAWRSGKIDLANETLVEAAAEFNRYNLKTIVIADPALADERFHGLFRTDDPEGFALAVRRSLNVPVEVSATEIRIGRSSE